MDRNISGEQKWAHRMDIIQMLCLIKANLTNSDTKHYRQLYKTKDYIQQCFLLSNANAMVWLRMEKDHFYGK